MDEALITVPHEQHLHVPGHAVARVRHHPVYGLQNEVNALLLSQPSNEAGHEDLGVLFEAHTLLELELAVALALLQCLQVVVHGNQGVGPGVVGDHVDAVEDPAKEELLLPHELVEAKAALAGLHLAGVARGDREQAVAGHNGTLGQVVHMSVVAVVVALVRGVLVDHVLVGKRAIEAKVVDVYVLDDNRQRAVGVRHKLVARVDALVSKIVDDEYATRVLVLVHGPHPVGQVHR
mmetsp:Transcript_45829/g.141837  ORF Transcript_45829/g.141837 Transcript_45829/m.141837 type:complete len:235 (-) Transcript_45829:617-1321(-)